MPELEKLKKAKIREMIGEAMNVFSLEEPQPGLSILLEAWELLPFQKYTWDEGYQLSNYIIHVYFRTGDYKNAHKWQDTFIQCDNANRNRGESEFMAGKIAYEMNNLEVAKNYFSIANTKSEGRCFYEEDKKYKKLLDKKDIRPTGFKELLNLSEKEIEKRNYSYALSLLYDCLNIERMDPKVYFLKGVCHFEHGEAEHAADSFARAYMLGELDPFEGQDKKYLEFTKTKIQI